MRVLPQRGYAYSALSSGNVRGHAAPTIEELYDTRPATTPNIVRAIEKRPSRAAA